MRQANLFYLSIALILSFTPLTTHALANDSSGNAISTPPGVLPVSPSTATTTPPIPVGVPSPTTVPSDATVPSATTPVDAKIGAYVKAKFSTDNRLIGQSITITVNDGAVTLNGEVDDRATADYAIGLARSIPGVTEVHSNLSLKNPLP